jgi:HemY protein
VSFYRSLLWWLFLAALGALAYQLLAPDLGDVVVRWHGQTLHTTVAFALAAWLLVSVAAWIVWYLARLPFRAWRRLARKQARTRLATGLAALNEGRWDRAESLLGAAAEDAETRTVARLAAREAALRRDDRVAAAGHLAALAKHDPGAAALLAADLHLAQDEPAAALASLQPLVDKRTLPPRGRALQVEALLRAGRAAEASERLADLRTDAVLPADALAALELRVAAGVLAEAPNVDVLDQRWRSSPAASRERPAVVAAYVRRAVALGLEDAAADALADVLDRHWDPGLVRLYAELPAGRAGSRRERAEGWLATHPDDPALLTALGRLSGAERLWARAEEQLHRALAHGGGPEAWETLGTVLTAQGDSARAELAYANALRTARGEPAHAFGGRTLREQIASEAVAELRNEHGLPLLRP